jgi:hypothetical protein
MGFLDFGKKKEPFKAPQEISALRMRIETESREKYPGLTNYKEIVRIAKSASRYLDGIIAQKQYAEEAARIKEDIRIKLECLAKKIDANLQEAKKDGKQDYVEKNIDYLERKSMRNNAKTVFAEFLEHAESFDRFLQGSNVAQGKTIELEILALFKAVNDLDENFVKIHGNDAEIQSLWDNTLRKLNEIHAVFNQQRAHFRALGLEACMEMGLDHCRKKNAQ